MRSPARITCEGCQCGTTIKNGWDPETQTVMNLAAGIIVHEVKMPRKNGCSNPCGCHTLIGVMPRFRISIGWDRFGVRR